MVTRYMAAMVTVTLIRYSFHGNEAVSGGYFYHKIMSPIVKRSGFYKSFSLQSL